MKTSFIFLFALALFLVSAEQSVSQSNVKSTSFKYIGVLPYNMHLNQKINDDLFLVYNQPGKNKASFVGYNSELKKVLNIDVEVNVYVPIVGVLRSNIFPFVFYNKQTNQILIVEIDYQKKGYDFRAKVYDTTGKLVKKESFFLEGKPDSFDKVELSEDGNYFSVYIKSGKKQENLSVTLYDFSLQRLYSKELQSGGEEIIEDYTLRPNGNVTLVSSTVNDQIELKSYNLKGELSQTIKLKKHISGKEKYGSYLLKVVGDRLILAAAKNFKDYLQRIDVFDVNLLTRQVKEYQSLEFDASYVEQLYEKVNVKDVLNTNYSLVSSEYRKPKYLENTLMQHILVDNDKIYIVSESREIRQNSKGRLMLFANDILITSFTASKNSWNSIIGRRMYTNGSLGGWSSTVSSVNLNGNNLQVLTSEYKMGTRDDISSYLRNVDINSGRVSAPVRLISQSSRSNTTLTSWLTPDKLVLFRTASSNINQDFTLDLINLPTAPIQ